MVMRRQIERPRQARHRFISSTNETLFPRMADMPGRNACALGFGVRRLYNPQPAPRSIMNKRRPKHLNLFKIRFPVMAIVSGMHRISGAVLFLFLPFFLWMLQASLESSQAFEAMRAVTANWFVKLVLLGLLWGYVHHFFAGIRHLALDLHMGTDLASARVSSMAVMIVSVGVTLVAGVLLW